MLTILVWSLLIALIISYNYNFIIRGRMPCTQFLETDHKFQIKTIHFSIDNKFCIYHKQLLFKISLEKACPFHVSTMGGII